MNILKIEILQNINGIRVLEEIETLPEISRIKIDRYFVLFGRLCAGVYLVS
jgi:hypothetical protein